MKRIAVTLLATLCATSLVHGQIRVQPEWVNTNTMGATTVFLTFGGLNNQVPVEAIWCGEIMDAAPDLGFKPVPGTIFGKLPIRFDLSSRGPEARFTDIMSIPPSVTRRAYQAAVKGARSTFFYVRRFISTTGGPDEYVVVTCELAGGGARSPFSITSVRLSFAEEQTLLSVKAGDPLPSFSSDITYTGTGQLKGRWELVRPGDEPPSETDLLTEATLPVERRAQQRRYTEIERFNVFLAPTGKFTLRGPDPTRLPTSPGGLYMILLRLEAAEDNEAESDFTLAGAGAGILATGGAAGFSIPPLRYFVGAGRGPVSPNAVTLLSPENFSELQPNASFDFVWNELPQAAFHRLVVIDPHNRIVLTAILNPGSSTYRAPPWLRDKLDATMGSWSIEALDEFGEVMAKSEWRTIRFADAK